MEQFLNKLYFDPSGFQSQQTMFQEARKTDKTVTVKDVKKTGMKNVNKTRYYGGKNSFVAPNANYEYQIDLFFISDLENQKFNTGMACIDVFTKYATVVPIRSKRPDDYLAGFMACIKKTWGRVQSVF